MTIIERPAAFFRTPRQLAALVRGDETPTDLQPDISNLIGWAKNFYLQYFAETHRLEITAFDTTNGRRVRPIERQLVQQGHPSDLLLVSHFLTMCQMLDEGRETSGELDRERAAEAVVAAIAELLGRISKWAETQDRPDLTQEAQHAHEEFTRAAAKLT